LRGNIEDKNKDKKQKVKKMPRRPRIKSEDAIYHIIQRGNERRTIFRGEEDKTRFLNTLKLNKRDGSFCFTF